MSVKFTEGNVYLCKSLMGAMPTFLNVSSPEDDASLWDYPDGCINISQDGKVYKYVPNIVTFKEGAEYECLARDPLMLKGPVIIPSIQPDPKMKLAMEAFSELLQESGMSVPRGIVRSMLEAIKWDIQHSWKGEVEGLRTLICDKVSKVCSNYNGTIRGYGTHEDMRQLFTGALLDAEYEILLNLLHAEEPECAEITMKWEKGKKPRCYLKDGTLLTDWFKKLITPVEG